MRMREILEGDVVSFKPKRRKLRHEIEILKLAKPGHPWVVYVNGQYLNAFKSESQAEKAAVDKEQEFDLFYDRNNIRYQIIPVGRDFILLNRGVRVGVYERYTDAERAAETLESGSTERMIHGWYR